MAAAAAAAAALDMTTGAVEDAGALNRWPGEAKPDVRGEPGGGGEPARFRRGCPGAPLFKSGGELDRSSEGLVLLAVRVVARRLDGLTKIDDSSVISALSSLPQVFYPILKSSRYYLVVLILVNFIFDVPFVLLFSCSH